MLLKEMIHHRVDVLLVRGSLIYALSNHAYKAESGLSANLPKLARAFYRLSAHTENQHRIVDAGALPALVARLCETGDQEIESCVVMAICSLSGNSSNEQNIMKACAMRALVDLLRSPSVECSKHAAMELCNLTANPANQLHLGCKTMVLTRL
ncbi:hypothetical protein PC115_g5792 [Phytophthora cactorum]|uniref:Vacuolar protein 8 n=1 Tax=Phytophthora cactorum TaxID=29920 RepID=A0A8T1CZA9_9STRA|nr:hypothetical protein PC115_g5792 [Phytophthora cactorum]KAG3191217.1 hypothetical protein C6341_g1342 [Phytophthora cactorum]